MPWAMALTNKVQLAVFVLLRWVTAANEQDLDAQGIADASRAIATTNSGLPEVLTRCAPRRSRSMRRMLSERTEGAVHSKRPSSPKVPSPGTPAELIIEVQLIASGHRAQRYPALGCQLEVNIEAACRQRPSSSKMPSPGAPA